jgi:hypothetical protein
MQTRKRVLGCVIAMSLGLGSQAASAAPAESSDLAALRSEIEAMKRDYEQRLRVLEERVQAAETRASEGAGAATGEPDGTESEETSATAGRGEGAVEPEAETAQPEATTLQTIASDAYARFARVFNPDISAILQGRVAYLQGWDGERSLPGYPLGGVTDRGHKGIALGESELVFSANVDDKLYGFFDVSFDQDDIGIEEAYLSTLSLPLGFGLKAGQFLSTIGYHNERHSHTWDFVDAPLVYEAMLDGSLSDPGLQITWVAPTDLYVELGGEVLRGDAYPAAGAANDGFGSATVFAKLAGDLGDSHSWLTGLSYLRAESNGRESEIGNYGTVSFDGTTDLVIADFVWKWAPLGNFRERNFTFQAEYMYRHERGRLASVSIDPTASGRYHSHQNGFYVQGVYQFMPRWRVGLRYGQLWSDNRVTDSLPGVFDRDGSSPRRISTMVDFSNSEFSRLRLQYSFESGDLGDDSLLYLQYIISIGSHGAHAF